MSALQAARQSDLEHSGLDETQWLRALVCMRRTHHRPQTPISGSWTGGWPECQWCLRVTVHIHTLVRARSIPPSCTPQAKDLTEYRKTDTWFDAKAHCIKKKEKKKNGKNMIRVSTWTPKLEGSEVKEMKRVLH